MNIPFVPKRKFQESVTGGQWSLHEKTGFFNNSDLFHLLEECEECEDAEYEQNSSRKRRAEEGKKNRNPPTSKKQLKKLGEPCRKMCRVEEESATDENKTQVVNSEPRPKPGEEGALVTKIQQSGNEGEKGESRTKGKEQEGAGRSSAEEG